MGNSKDISPFLKLFVYLLIIFNLTTGTSIQLLKISGELDSATSAAYWISSVALTCQIMIIRSYFLGHVTLKTVAILYMEINSLLLLVFAFIRDEKMKLLRLILSMNFSYTASNLTESTRYKVWQSIKLICVFTALQFLTGQIKFEGIFELINFLLTVFCMLTLLENEARKTELIRTLEETKRQLSAVLSVIPVGIFVMTSREEVYTSNSACLRLLGCISDDQIREQIGGMNYKERHRQYAGETHSLLQDLRHYIASYEDLSVTFGQTQNSDKTLQWIGQKTTWSGEPAAIVVITDVTEVIQLERAKNESSFKNIMLRSVSHELKTPTNAILHAVQSVVRQYELPPKAKYNLRIAEVSCKSLLMLIRDLLDFSSIMAGRFSLSPSRFNLRECLSDCVDLIGLAADKKQLRIVRHFDPLLPETVYTDQNRLSQVLLNLLSNSAKFTHRGGRIEVRALLNDFGQMEVSVTDTGIGISPEHLANLFNSFNRIESSASINRQGTGLGLNISNMLAIELGGAPIQVQSIINAGSCFKFIVDIGNSAGRIVHFFSDYLYEEETHDSAQSVYVFDVVSRMYPPVLVVDDTPFNRHVIVDILSSSHIECAEAESGQCALDYVIERALSLHPVEVIVMDFEMPEMNGPTASRLILQRLTELRMPHPRIIAHTAYSSEADIQICREAGMIDFIPKPSDMGFILSMIRRHL